MPIRVQVVSERGEVRVEGVGAVGYLEPLLPGYEGSDFPLLRYVDPYGDTVFNGLQCRAVLDELGRLEAAARTEADKRTLRALSELAEMMAGGVHLFLRFVGD